MHTPGVKNRDWRWSSGARVEQMSMQCEKVRCLRQHMAWWLTTIQTVRDTAEHLTESLCRLPVL